MASRCLLLAVAAIWMRAAGVRMDIMGETQPEPALLLLMQSFSLIHEIIDDFSFRTSDIPKRLSEGKRLWGIPQGRADGTVFSTDLLEQWKALKAYRDLTVKVATECGSAEIDRSFKFSLQRYARKAIERTSHFAAEHYCPKMVAYITEEVRRQILFLQVAEKWSWVAPSFYFFKYGMPNRGPFSGNDGKIRHLEKSQNHVLGSEREECKDKASRKIEVEEVAQLKGEDPMKKSMLQHFVDLMKDDVLPRVEMVLDDCGLNFTDKLPPELLCMYEFEEKISAAAGALQIRATFESLTSKVTIPSVIQVLAKFLSDANKLQSWWKNNIVALKAFENPQAGAPLLKAILIVSKFAVREVLNIAQSCEEAASDVASRAE